MAVPDSTASCTLEQLDTLRHMLGINDPSRKPIPYRDYYCANPGDPNLHELQRIGKVVLYSSHGGYEWFRCTDEGRVEAIASVPVASRGRQRYLNFLNARECNQDLTFGQFLKRQANSEATRS